jgi:hypothetical protein
VGRRKKGAPTSGAGVSASQKKKKKKRSREAGRCGDGEMGRWTGWVRKGGEPLFFFSFFKLF